MCVTETESMATVCLSPHSLVAVIYTRSTGVAPMQHQHEERLVLAARSMYQGRIGEGVFEVRPAGDGRNIVSASPAESPLYFCSFVFCCCCCLYYGANARQSNTFLQTLAGPVYIPSYGMPMACRTHNLQAQNHYHHRRHRRRHRRRRRCRHPSRRRRRRRRRTTTRSEERERRRPALERAPQRTE